MLMQLHMLKLSVGKSHQIIKQLYRRVLQYYASATVATERAEYVLYRTLVYTQSFWALLLGSKVVRHCLVGFYAI